MKSCIFFFFSRGKNQILASFLFMELYSGVRNVDGTIRSKKWTNSDEF